MTNLIQAVNNTATIKNINNTIYLSGNWTWNCINKNIIDNIIIKDIKFIDASQVVQIDHIGAFFVREILSKLDRDNLPYKLNITDQYRMFFEKCFVVEKTTPKITEKKTENIFYTFLSQLFQSIVFLGYFISTFVSNKINEWQVLEITSMVIECCCKGLFISMSLCFLIGLNLSYQMVPQFATYGANIYIVNFLGIALLREVTPLITAIIAAGRTGSAITASLGAMKIQEEIDALEVMGISAMRRLIIPRVIALVISLPILTLMSNIASMIGGILVAQSSLGISPQLFLHRLQQYVLVNNYLIGMSKSIAFGLVISFVACFCGITVKSNAFNLGTQTTKSVVMSLCLIVTVDAIFAIVTKTLMI